MDLVLDAISAITHPLHSCLDALAAECMDFLGAASESTVTSHVSSFMTIRTCQSIEQVRGGTTTLLAVTVGMSRCTRSSHTSSAN